MVDKRTLKKRVSIFVLVFTLLFQTLTPIVTFAFADSEDAISISRVERIGDSILIEGVTMGDPESQLFIELGENFEIVQQPADGAFIIEKPVELLKLFDKIQLKFGNAIADLTGEILGLIGTDIVEEDEIIPDPIEEENPIDEPEIPEDPEDVPEEAVEIPEEVEELPENPEEIPEIPEEEVIEEEIVDPEEELKEEGEDELIPENPDGLEVFDDTPIPYISENYQDSDGVRGSMDLMGGSLQPGEVDTESIITPTSGMVNTWDVVLRVYGKDSAKTNDIVLVIDTSGSMGDYGRMAAAKAAANDFIDTLLGPNGAPGTRIAIVSFAGDVTTNQTLTNNVNALKNAVNGLSASGGTYTQAGVRRAREILAGSTADYKNIVLLSDGEPTYSMKMNNPDNYIIPFGIHFETHAEAPENAYISERGGNGSDLRWSYRQEGTFWNRIHYYYNHGNSAIAEAGFAKSNATMYTVALSAGAIGTPILNQMASPGHAYDSDPASLGQAFQSIASSILSAVRDGSAPTCLASGFEVDAADVMNIEAKGSTYELINDNKNIKWNIPNLILSTSGVPELKYDDPTIKYAQLKFRITINDDIVADDNVDITGTFNPLEGMVINYKDINGDNVSIGMEQKDIDPVLIVLKKAVLKAGGTVVPNDDGTGTVNGEIVNDDGRIFRATLTNVTQSVALMTKDLKPNQRVIVKDIRLEDRYVVHEVHTNWQIIVDGTAMPANADDYENPIVIKTQGTIVNSGYVDAGYGPYSDLQFDINDDSPDAEFTIYNIEKPLGKLEIEKIVSLQTRGTDGGIGLMGAPGEIPEFTMNINGPTNKTETLKGGESKVVEGLAYGEYTVVETPLDGFTPTYDPADGKVILTIRDRYKNLVPKVTVTNNKTVDSLSTTVEATKTWVNGNSTDHDAAVLKLYRIIGNEEQLINSSPAKSGTAPTYTYTWSNVEKYDPVTGTEYAFKVIEEGVANGEVIINGRTYQVTYDASGLAVTNTYKVEQTDDLIATKTWSGTIPGEQSRPDIWFELWRSGGEAGEGEKVVDAVKVENNQHNFGKQNKTDLNGIEYTYFVKEVDANGNELVLPNYSTTIDGLNVANTVKTPDGNLTISKVFVNNPSKLSIRGMQSFVFDVTGPYGYSKEVTIVGSGEETLTGLYEGEYRVVERALPDFDITYNPAEGKVTLLNGETKTVTVTNTVKSSSTESLRVEKAWGEEVPQGAKVPVTVYLIKNGTRVEGSDIVLSNTNGWTHTWTGLEKYKPDSSLNVYTVGEELEDPNIISTTTPIEGGYKITNDVRPVGDRTGQLTIEKEFNNRRSSKIGLEGIRGGDLTFMVTVTNPYGEESRHEIKVGEPLVLENQFFGEYTVVEDASDEYSTTYNPADGKVVLTEAVPSGTIKVINTVGAETGLIDLTVTKTWENGPNRNSDDVRFKVTRTSTNVTTPEEITVAPTSEEITTGHVFKYTWRSLEVYDNKGAIYNYSVEELGVIDGKLVVNGDVYIAGNMLKEGNKFTIENVYLVQVDGEAIANKVWDMSGAGENYPNPERVDVHFKLYRNIEGEEPVPVEGGDLKLIEKDATDLSVKWENLAVTDDDGNRYIYTVKEVDAEGNDFTPENFNKVENGLTVTNRIKSDNERDAKLTVKKVLENEPSGKRILGFLRGTEPLEFEFKVTGPYGYEEIFTLKAGEEKELTGLYYGDYKVEETNSHGYTASYDPADEVSINKETKDITVTVTNRNAGGDDTTVSKTITKVWVNGPKPGATLELWRTGQEVDGTAIDEKVGEFAVTAENLSKTFENLAKHDPSGREFEYYAKEPTVPENYTAVVEGLKVTNTYASPSTEDIIATKVWAANNPENVTKPGIKFELWRKNGTAGEGQLVVAATALTENQVNFGPQDKTDIDGVEYEYYVKEVYDNPEDPLLENWSKEEVGLQVTNTVNAPVGKLTVKKELIDNSSIGTMSRDLPIKFTFKVTGPYGYNQTFELAAGESKELTNLFYGEYKVEEIDTQGYVPTYDPVEGKVTLSAITKVGNVSVTNKHKAIEDPNSVEVVATKVWVNGPKADHTPVDIDIFRTSSKMNSDPELVLPEQYELNILGSAPEFNYTWSKLAKHDPEGYEYNYHVSEKGVDENGEIVINGNTYVVTQDENKITNTFKVPTGEIEASKVWVNGDSTNRPTVYFKLFRQIGQGNPEVVPDAPIKALEHGTTKVSWEVEKQNPAGVDYIFRVLEYTDPEGNNEGAPENYTVDYNRLEVTNTYNSPTENVMFTKVWEGGKAPRPTVYFKLFRTTSETIEPVAVEGAEVKAIADGESTATWENMPRTNEFGVNYIYSVKEFKDAEGDNEGAPENYNVNYTTGFRIVKNIYEIPLGDITLNKEWVGGPDDHPDTWFTLSRSLDGEDFENVPNSTIKVEANQVTWKDVELTDSDGNEYIFKPFESNADGYPFTPAFYEFELQEVEDNNFSATNKFNPQNDGVFETYKEWDISTLDDGLTVSYPTMLFTLYRSIDGVNWEKVPNVDPIEITENQTDAKWEGLEKLDPDGIEYQFKVVETFKEDNPTNDNWVEEKSISGLEGILNRLIYNDSDDDDHEDEKIASLTIKKVITPKSAETSRKFKVRITGPYGYEKVIEIASGKSVELKELYYGKYTVTEINPDGFEPQYSAREVILRKNNPKAEITITNKKIEDPTYPIWPIWPVDPTTPELNKRDHFGYVIGYPQGDFRPENTITRAEMTAIFARLLEEKIFLNKDYPIPFDDVSRNAWYAEYVGMLTQVGVISGYPDGSFRPENPVTRAEFATVASRFIASKKTVFGGFTDIASEYWAKESIQAAYAEGWLKGYPDGSFRPERELTRAEAVTIINRMLDRVADRDYVDINVKKIVNYTDLTKAHWAYYDIMEASNSHDYVRLNNRAERWTRHWRPY